MRNKVFSWQQNTFFFVGIVVDLFICCFLVIISGFCLCAIAAVYSCPWENWCSFQKLLSHFFFSCFKSNSFFIFSVLCQLSAMQLFPKKDNDFLSSPIRRCVVGMDVGICHYTRYERNEVPVHRGLATGLNYCIPVSVLNCTMSRRKWSRSGGIYKGRK